MVTDCLLVRQKTQLFAEVYGICYIMPDAIVTTSFDVEKQTFVANAYSSDRFLIFVWFVT